MLLWSVYNSTSEDRECVHFVVFILLIVSQFCLPTKLKSDFAMWKAQYPSNMMEELQKKPTLKQQQQKKTQTHRISRSMVIKNQVCSITVWSSWKTKSCWKTSICEFIKAWIFYTHLGKKLEAFQKAGIHVEKSKSVLNICF